MTWFPPGDKRPRRLKFIGPWSASALAILGLGSLCVMPFNCVDAHLPPTSSLPSPLDAGKVVDPPVIPLALLTESWERYKTRFVQSDGRVIDRKANGISTSEGQAYGLLRSVWMRDKATFDRIWQWTQNNLNTPARKDKLFAWKWGQLVDGTWGVMDKNSASDADQLIAWSLLLAADRFGQEVYRVQGAAILPDLWNRNTQDINGFRYMLAGDWRPDTGPLPVNPSYQMPFLYKSFARADPEHAWSRLITSSYQLLEQARTQQGLPADWCYLDSQTGQLTLDQKPDSKFSDFGYEAFRVYWNLAAAHRWEHAPEARALLDQMGWLTTWWKVRQELPAVITWAGVPRESWRSLGMYGAFLPALAVLDPAQAWLLFQKGIAPTYKDGYWGESDDYYAQNWVWLGLALSSERPAP